MVFEIDMSSDAYLLNALQETDVPCDDAIVVSAGKLTQDLSRRAACGRSPAEIMGSNPTGGMDICLL